MGWTQRSAQGSARLHLPSNHFRASCSINTRYRPAPRSGSSTASSFQPCCMVWRALSSLSLLCIALSPLWSIVCGSSWEFQSGRKSDTPPYARLSSSRGSHPFSLSAVCVSLGTYPGCQRKDYLSSFLCLPLLGASVLPGDRSVGANCLASFCAPIRCSIPPGIDGGEVFCYADTIDARTSSGCESRRVLLDCFIAIATGKSRSRGQPSRK